MTKPITNVWAATEGNTSDIGGDVAGDQPETHDQARASDDGMPSYDHMLDDDDGNEDDLGVKWGPASDLTDRPEEINLKVGEYDPETDRAIAERAIAFIRASIGNPDTKRWALFQFEVTATGGADGEASVDRIQLAGTIDDNAVIHAALTLAAQTTDVHPRSTMDI